MNLPGGTILRFPFSFLLIALLMLSGHFAYALEKLAGFPNSAPGQVISDDAGRFYLDYGRDVYIYNKGEIGSVSLRNKYGRMTVNSRHTTVTNKGEIITFVTASYSETKAYYVDGKLQTTTVVVESGSFVEMCTLRCTYRRVGGALGNSGFVRDARGRVFYTIEQPKADADYYINGVKVGKTRFEQEQRESLPAQIYPDKTNTMGGILDGDIVIDHSISGPGKSRSTRFRGNYSIIWDSNNNPHVFFHDPEERNFRHHYFNRSDKKIYQADVDFSESGYENMAFADGDAIWTIHYFYRDPFNKGLLVSVLDNSSRIQKQFVLDASHKQNIGWELRGARAPDGKILITYLKDKETNTRAFLLLNGSKDLVTMGENLAAYGHVEGPDKMRHLSVAEQQELGRELADSFRKELKTYALSVGVGAQYAFWHLTAESEIDYDIDNALVNMVEFQGKLFNIDYGVEYAEEIVESNITQSDATKNVIQYTGAYVGWEKLLYNYDFKLSFESSKTKVKLTDNSTSTRLNYEMDYVGLKLSLLTQQRSQFGLVYQKYNQFRRIERYDWTIPGGWLFNGSGLGELDTKVFAFHYGYTTVNYLEKYGVNENRGYVDFEGRLGLAFYDFKGPTTVPWAGQTPDVKEAPVFAGQLELGWIWFRRWKSLGGIGGYVKAGYRINLDYYFNPRFDSEEDGGDAEKTEYFIDESMMVRHGPLIMAGFNF